MLGKEPTFRLIYALSKKELKTLRESLNKDLVRGFIRKSTSLAEYPILFVPKKNSLLQQCIDYCKLNNIIIKNRYLLPNIIEI